MLYTYYKFVIIVASLFVCLSCTKENIGDDDYKKQEVRLMRKWVNYMCSDKFGGRCAGTDGGKIAADYIFSNLDHDQSSIINIPSISEIDGMHNVQFSMKGKIDSTIVIGAHFDSYGIYNGTLRPGADDNMSGVAVLMTLANRLSKKTSLKYNIDICFWDGEEVGRYGSSYYLLSNANHQKCKLYINVDTCGSKCCYNLGVLYNQNVSNINALFEDYSYNLQLEYAPYSPLGFITDCESFDVYGIPYLTIGSMTHPCHIHTTNDSPEILDYNQMWNIFNMLYNYIIDNYEYDTI